MGLFWRQSSGKGRLIHALASWVSPSHFGSMPTFAKFRCCTIDSGSVLARCRRPWDPKVFPLRSSDLTLVKGKALAMVQTSEGPRLQARKATLSIIGNSSTCSMSSLSLPIPMSEISSRRNMDVEATCTSCFKLGTVMPHPANFRSVKCDFFASSRGQIAGTTLSQRCGLDERSTPRMRYPTSISKILPRLSQDMSLFLLRSTQCNTASTKSSFSMNSRIVFLKFLALTSHNCVYATVLLSVMARDSK
mmetsp:Transcript_83164/g.235298  ORF Transcript_83164/g.235298 Transcript_83164/m.235298 type:complete len:248 (+) Transcript_83164:275-1018(+)